MVNAAIYGCKGARLQEAEREFFRAADPWGFILFRRNCESAEQVIALCADLRGAVGRDVPILVDHEGGRISRLSPHIAPKRPPTAIYGLIAEEEGLEAGRTAARLGGEILARDASDLGFSVNCVPMIDVRQEGAHDIVGDRAFSTDPSVVAALGAAMAEGSLRGGCLPVIKHIPGHGRAMADSHLSLPQVDTDPEILSAVDFAPFRALKDQPLGMTAHIVYSGIDADRPATLSRTVIDGVIRKQIGFTGLLMTDDLSMKALEGGYRERTEKSLEAGCDLVLHCNGDMEEMEAVAEGAGPLTPEAVLRSDRALSQLRRPGAVDREDLEARFAERIKPYTVGA